jgi:poly(A) polymerase
VETIQIMLERGLLRPVVPEIGADALPRLQQLVDAEAEAGVAPDGLRRLSSLLPRDPVVAVKVAARLKLSNKARKRLSSAAATHAADPQERAYRLGPECAVDTLLLEGRSEEARSVASWNPPLLPVGGGALIAAGVPQGPEVARILRRIEDAWIAEGFPDGEPFQRLVAGEIARARS